MAGKDDGFIIRRSDENPADIALEQSKRELVSAFGRVARATGLSQSVNSQRGLVALGQILDAHGAGQTIDLSPFFDFLIRSGANEKTAVEVFILLEANAERIGLAISTPAPVSRIPATERQMIVERLTSQGSVASAYSGRGKQAEAAPEEPARKYARNPRKVSGIRPDKHSANWPLLVVLAVLVIATFGVYSRVLADRSRQNEVIEPFIDGAALPCKRIVKNGKTAVCTLAVGDYQYFSSTRLREAGVRTENLLREKGATRLLIRTDDGKFQPW